MIEISGWLAALLFATCGFPQAYQCYKDGNAEGLSLAFLWMWFGGEVGYQIYVLGTHGLDLPLLINYWVNTIVVLVLFRYKYFPKG